MNAGEDDLDSEDEESGANFLESAPESQN